MSELQLGLLSVGAVIVAAVFLYNKWQDRRYRREAEAGFASRHEDVLMRPDAGQGNLPSGPERVEPVLVSFESEREDARASRLSEVLDFIVSIETPEETSAAAMIGATAAALERCSKSISWEGFDETAASWEPLDPDRSYSKLRSGMQLVDRRGAADVEELAAFGAAMERAAASVGALATAPDPESVLDKARELDRFCGEVDIRVAVHIMSDTAPVPGTQLAGVAKAAGFRLDEPDGKFRLRDEAGRVVCALANFEATANPWAPPHSTRSGRGFRAYTGAWRRAGSHPAGRSRSGFFPDGSHGKGAQPRGSASPRNRDPQLQLLRA